MSTGLGIAGLLRRYVFPTNHERIGLTAENEICMDSDEPLQPFFLCEPPEQVRMFIQMFCSYVALFLVMYSGGAERYYTRLAGSGCAVDRLRGLGYNGAKIYGIFPVPRLPVGGVRLAGWLLVGALLLACDSQLTPRFFLFASYGLYFLYFGQLSCESKHGGHGAILLPSVILLLALSGGPQGTPWSLVFIKVYLGVVYFAGALSKILVSALFGQPWLGSTMQAYLLDAMWSRPSPWKVVRQMQGFIITRWWACTSMAVTGMVFELGFLPLVLFGEPIGAVLAATVAIGFHAGVGVLQGLDFFPFWCPVFFAFFPDVRLLLSGRAPTEEETLVGIMAQGFEEEPWRWVFSAAYLGGQVIVALRFMDLRAGKECLPFSCCPMFSAPRNVFGDEMRGGVLTDVDLRSGGFLDVAYNFFPWHAESPLTEDDMKQYPGRLLFWMTTTHCHPLLERWFRSEFLDKEFLLMANFDVAPALRNQLYELARALEASKAKDWSDAEKVSKLLGMQANCQALFREGACARVSGTKDPGGTNWSAGKSVVSKFIKESMWDGERLVQSNGS